MSFVMQITLDTSYQNGKLATAVVFVEADENVSIETLLELAEKKARKNIAGFEKAVCIDCRYLGLAKSFHIVE